MPAKVPLAAVRDFKLNVSFADIASSWRANFDFDKLTNEGGLGFHNE
jgi:hypothetical protein